jgi:hypothetical protein
MVEGVGDDQGVPSSARLPGLWRRANEAVERATRGQRTGLLHRRHMQIAQHRLAKVRRARNAVMMRLSGV